MFFYESHCIYLSLLYASLLHGSQHRFSALRSPNFPFEIRMQRYILYHQTADVCFVIFLILKSIATYYMFSICDVERKIHHRNYFSFIFSTSNIYFCSYICWIKERYVLIPFCNGGSFISGGTKKHINTCNIVYLDWIYDSDLAATCPSRHALTRPWTSCL